jgi:hypothetical protein
MASPVLIDIPGVGQVEAKNAATESTLRELVNIMKGLKGGGGGGGGMGGGGGAGGGAGGGGAGGGGAGGKAAGAAGQLMKGAASAMGAPLKLLGAGFKGLSAGVSLASAGAQMVGGTFKGLSTAIVDTISNLANVGDSLTAAASSLSVIPVVGGLLAGVLGAVAAAAEATTGAFQQASQSGASFGGSVGEFSKAASGAGMTMKDFAGVIQNNRDAMLAFGGTSEAGAKNFANVSKALRSGSSDLYALGFSTKDINEGLGKYGSLLRAQGLQGKQTNAELASGAKSYMKELDLLAKATGQSRSEIEARQAAMAKDAQFQAAMAGASEDVRKSFLAVTSGMPKGLETFTKDMLANGTATTEENQKLLSQLPQSAAMLTSMNQKMQRGEAVTLEERNALTNLMKEEGARNLKNIKQAGAASAELSGTVNALAATQEINTDGLKQANAEQAKSAKTTDGLNKQVEESKAKLAAFSNGFQMALANSGMLDVLMSAFEMLANFAMQYLVPAMNLIFGVVQKVWSGFTILLAPVIESISGMLGDAGLGGTIAMVDSAMNAVFPVLSAIVRAVIIAVEGLWNGLKLLVQPVESLFGLFGDVGNSSKFLTDTLLLAGDILGGIFGFLGSIIGGVIDQFVFVVTTLKNVLMSMDWFKDGVNKASDFIGKAIDMFRMFVGAEGGKYLINLLYFGINKVFSGLFGMIADILPDNFGGNKMRDLSKSFEEQAKINDEKTEVAKTAAVEEKKQRDLKLEAHKEGVKQDDARFRQQKLHVSKMGGLQKEEEDAKKKSADAEVVKNYNDPLALLKAEATQQQSDIIPKSEIKNIPTAGTASADLAGATKAIEAAAEQKKQEAEKKIKEEAEKKKQEEEKKPGATQDSAVTLLAQLNTNMAHLIKLTAQTTDNTYATVVAARGLSGNLFKA